MKEKPTEKDLRQFKISLLLLPIIPAIILYFKHHYTIATILLIVFWSLLILTLLPRLIGKNADKFMYGFCRTILNFLGAIIAGIALIITWFCAILPTALLAKAMKRDRLSLQKQNVSTYWKEAKKSEPTYENQY